MYISIYQFLYVFIHGFGSSEFHFDVVIIRFCVFGAALGWFTRSFWSDVSQLVVVWGHPEEEAGCWAHKISQIGIFAWYYAFQQTWKWSSSLHLMHDLLLAHLSKVLHQVSSISEIDSLLSGLLLFVHFLDLIIRNVFVRHVRCDQVHVSESSFDFWGWWFGWLKVSASKSLWLLWKWNLESTISRLNFAVVLNVWGAAHHAEDHCKEEISFAVHWVLGISFQDQYVFHVNVLRFVGVCCADAATVQSSSLILPRLSIISIFFSHQLLKRFSGLWTIKKHVIITLKWMFDGMIVSAYWISWLSIVFEESSVDLIEDFKFELVKIFLSDNVLHLLWCWYLWLLDATNEAGVCKCFLEVWNLLFKYFVFTWKTSIFLE